MEPSFTPASRETIEEKVEQLPAYKDSGKTGNGLFVEVKTTPEVQGWNKLVEKHGWYIDRIVFRNESTAYVSIFPITEVPDSDGE